MKTHLLYRDRDFDFNAALPPASDALVRDLGLTTLLETMSQGDKSAATVIEKIMLTSCVDVDTILYRQEVLKDCVSCGAIVKEMYDLAVRAIKEEESDFIGSLARSPASVLHRSISLLESFASILQQLRSIADAHAEAFQSEGLRSLLIMLRKELNDEYLFAVRDHLKQLAFRHGVLISARLGEGNKGTDYVLCKQRVPERRWFRRRTGTKPASFSFRIPDRDESGARALDELRARGLSLVASALGQSTDHILSFFTVLQAELTFYLGCLNLYGQLSGRSEVCFPEPTPPDERRFLGAGLYDICLSLKAVEKLVPNDVNADERELVVITGANQGGKSTFLRSLGIAQLMMQCGMFVPARTFRANVCQRIFSHFKREEDPTMESGKLDEELSRMSYIVDNIIPDSLVLFNESFAATNEREGSEIGEQIVSALIERRIKVFFVTHQYEFARRFYAKQLPCALFLRAERLADGTRTFKIVQGEPLQTSYGADLYQRIFGESVKERSLGELLEQPWLSARASPEPDALSQID
jgi:DNA mismatch repair ATPase MutS